MIVPSRFRVPWPIWRRGVSGDLSLWDHSQLRFQCSGLCFASTTTEFSAVIASALPSETHEGPIVFSSVLLLRMCDASIWVYSVCQFSWVAFSKLCKCFLNSSAQSRGHCHELRNLSSAASWIGGIFYFHDGEMGKTMACNMGTRSGRPFGSSKAFIEEWIRSCEYPQSYAPLVFSIPHYEKQRFKSRPWRDTCEHLLQSVGQPYRRTDFLCEHLGPTSLVQSDAPCSPGLRTLTVTTIPRTLIRSGHEAMGGAAMVSGLLISGTFRCGCPRRNDQQTKISFRNMIPGNRSSYGRMISTFRQPPHPSDPYPLLPRIPEARVCKLTSFIK